MIYMVKCAVKSKKQVQGSSSVNVYEKSFYETVLHIGEEETVLEFLKAGFFISLACYICLLTAVWAVCVLFRNCVINLHIYHYAALSLCTIVFWPMIIIYDSKLFYKVFDGVRPLAKSESEIVKWYRRNALCAFTFSSETDNQQKRWHFISSLLIILSAAAIFIAAVMGLFTRHFALFILLGAVIVSVLALALSSRNRYLNVTLTTVCCGLAYYLYLLNYSSSRLPPFSSNDVLNDLLLPCVVIVFFIAGTTIYPMFGTLKAFYFDGLSDIIDTPFESLSDAVHRIVRIKKHFHHLIGVSCLAYFQLLTTVYLMGALNRNSILTLILFAFGSFLPLMMYFASDILFKRFLHKLYLKNVEGIDQKINELVNAKVIDGDVLQGLAAVKEIMTDEFEEHDHMNIELITALLSPVITTVLAFIFPIA